MRGSFVAAAFVILATPHSIAAQPLTLDQRLAARKAIEAVYWSHRTWPDSNPGPKPSFSAALPGDVLRARVDDELARGRALEQVCGQTISPEALQAELDRIGRATRRPAMLAELFAALNHDARLVAECLVRPLVVERLLAGCQQRDPRVSFDAWWAATRPSVAAGRSVFEDAAFPFRLPEFNSGACACADDTWLGPTEVEPQARSHHTAVWTGAEMIVWGGVYGGGAEWGGSGQYPLGTGGRYDPALDSWTPTALEGAPARRAQHSAVWTGSEMIVWGGRSGIDSVVYDDGFRYDPENDAWTPTSHEGAPAARWAHSVVWTGSEMIVWGGAPGQHPLGTGGRYDAAADRWTPTSTIAAPSSRAQHTAVWTGTEMIVWGGTSDGSGGRYAPSTDTWRPVATGGAPLGRFRHTAVWSTRGMLVFGGTTSFGAQVFTGGRYDPGADAWSPIPASGMERENHTAVWTGTEMILFGGRSGIDWSYTDPRAYDPWSDTWRILPAAPLRARRSHTAVWTGSEMIVWGGLHEDIGLEGFREYSDGARYDPLENGWTLVRTSGAPALRSLHSAVWTGAEMIVWGGFNPGNSSDWCCLNDGSRYDPALDAWFATGTGGLSPRQRHTAVWTGSEMIVWGGDDGPPHGTGARYDPTTNAWLAVTATGAPVPRTEHTAVWTGREMIVWGGERHPYVIGDGGRYDPALDSWAPVPLDGAPAPRRAHSAVWTGNTMLVWGGSGDAGALASGAAFDPAGGGRWTAIDAGSAPPARSNHVAVWTDDEMIVWGGIGPDLACLSSGGRYDPERGAWTPTSVVDAPVARARTTAVWTGTEMIVWGGATSSADYARGIDTGGRYAPSADRWHPTSGIAAPLARRDHSVVWTGEELILWSGEGGGSSGGRYCASCAWARRYHDADGDGHGDPGTPTDGCGTEPGLVMDGTDCDDGSASVFAVPREVRHVAIAADHETLTWESAAPEAGSATTHDVFRETLVRAPVGSSPDATCVTSDEAGTLITDDLQPPDGSSFLYLVRGGNSCGTGSWGCDSEGVERVPDACP